jgi:hypothetical protein
MTEQKSNVRPYAIALAVLAGLTRLMPHPPNFTAVGGGSLFAGARLNGWLAYVLPLLVMAATDPFVGGFDSSTPFVYAAILLNVLIGRSLCKTNNPVRIGAAAFACSTQFFLVSNLGYFFGYTDRSLHALSMTYVSAIPFWGKTLAGDLFFTATLFGLHYFLTRTVASRERVPVTA